MLRVTSYLQEVERGKTKCARYWPDTVDSSEEYGAFSLRNTAEESSKDYTLRQFTLSRLGEAGETEERNIFHFHFLGWPGEKPPSNLTSLNRNIQITARRRTREVSSTFYMM